MWCKTSPALLAPKIPNVQPTWDKTPPPEILDSKLAAPQSMSTMEQSIQSTTSRCASLDTSLMIHMSAAKRSKISPLVPKRLQLNALPLHRHQPPQDATAKAAAPHWTLTPPLTVALPEAGTLEEAPTTSLQASVDRKISISPRTRCSPTLLIQPQLPPLTNLSSTVFATHQPTPMSTALPTHQTVALISF